jgi:hypothetical protein
MWVSRQCSTKQPAPLASGIDPLVFEKIRRGEDSRPIGEEKDFGEHSVLASCWCTALMFAIR